jgi:hypothetical protein
MNVKSQDRLLTAKDSCDYLVLSNQARNVDEYFNECLNNSVRLSKELKVRLLPLFIGKLSYENIRVARYYGDIRNSNNEIILMLFRECDREYEHNFKVRRFYKNE